MRLSREQQRLWHTLAAGRNAPRAVLLRAVTGPSSSHTQAILCRHFRRTGAAGLGAVLVQWAHLRVCYGGPEEPLLSAAARAALRLFDQELEPILQRPRLLNGQDLQREFHLPAGPRFKGLLAAVAQAELMGQVTTREEAVEFVRRHLRPLEPKPSPE
jgi:hypothetical protein